MQQKASKPTMPDITTGPEAWPLPELQRARRAIVVVDVVESVRLMQEDEAGFIERWRRFVHAVRTEVLPKHGGTLVKSLGDGLLLTFGSVPQAIDAARACHAWLPAHNGAAPLRIGVHVADVTIDDIDVYGHGVNLTARLASLAKASQTVLSVQARECVVDGLDSEVVDLGECYVKHVDRPVRAFAVANAAPSTDPPRPVSLLPHLMVMPLVADAQIAGMARVLTDDLVRALSARTQWTVMSRLSTTALADRADTPLALAKSGADYLLQGSVVVRGGDVLLRVALREVRTMAVVMEHDLQAPLVTTLMAEERVTEQIAALAGVALCTHQMRAASVVALPNMPGYGLLLSAMSLLHRLGAEDFDNAHNLLEHLVERHPRAPEARAWLAQWHFLQIAQRRTLDTSTAAQAANRQLHLALDVEPKHALALALAGHLEIYANGQPQKALPLLRQATEAGPNEPLAWLFFSNTLAATGDGAGAVVAAERACALSPFDPLGYYYDLFAANAYSAAGQHEQALVFAKRSVARNAMHLSSWVQLIIEQALTNRMDDARATAVQYLVMRPTASVQRFLSTHIAKGSALAERDGRALIEAGIPD
jgi:adenylate cyclase